MSNESTLGFARARLLLPIAEGRRDERIEDGYILYRGDEILSLIHI